MALPFPGNPENDRYGKCLHWHILGGNNKKRVGANAGLCVYEERDSEGKCKTRALLFDAGLMPGDSRHPEDPALAECDTVIPDLTRFLRKLNEPAHKPEIELDAIFLTHNHSDHIGALPFLVLMGYALPRIYATPYTAKRLEQEFSNAGLSPSDWPEVHMIAPGMPVSEGPVKVSAFWVSHSTPQSVGFFIETPEGNILNPGDFKLDQSVVWGPAFDEAQFKKLVSKEVDLMLLDSTGADRDITPTTEEDVRETLRGLMDKYPRKRFIVAVMGGFEENLASLAKVSAEKGRGLWVAGWSHEQALAALQETGLSLADHIGHGLKVRSVNPGRAARDLAETKPGFSVVVVTGAQGGNSSVLGRAAEGHHPALKLDPKNDIILFCAPSIPGNEGSRERLLATLRKNGFTVLTRAEATLYSQAHARLPELVEMAALAQAKMVMPVHGDASLRRKNAEALQKIGQKTLMADNGDVIKVTKTGCFSVNPATKGKPKLTGFKTMQGRDWTDRNYLMVTAPQESPVPNKAPANSNVKKRPKIFRL